nr:uncharacterized protein LOC131770959 isoform X2 [Pocillopora verrucosa]
MLSKYSSRRVTRSEIIAHTAFFLSFIVTITAHDCHRRLETVWQSDFGSSPVVSSALVADFNGDNVRDVLATSLDGQPVGCIRTRIVIRGSSKLFGKCHNCVQSSHKTACVLINFACVQGGGIVVGTSSGTVYFIKSSLNEPLSLSTMDSVPGQVIISGVNQDGVLEILAIDNSGNIACKDLNGKMVWEATVSSSSASGIRVADVDGDGFMKAVVATFDHS